MQFTECVFYIKRLRLGVPPFAHFSTFPLPNSLRQCSTISISFDWSGKWRQGRNWLWIRGHFFLSTVTQYLNFSVMWRSSPKLRQLRQIRHRGGGVGRSSKKRNLIEWDGHKRHKMENWSLDYQRLETIAMIKPTNNDRAMRYDGFIPRCRAGSTKGKWKLKKKKGGDPTKQAASKA